MGYATYIAVVATWLQCWFGSVTNQCLEYLGYITLLVTLACPREGSAIASSNHTKASSSDDPL